MSLLSLFDVLCKGSKGYASLIDHMEQFQFLKSQKVEDREYILN